MKKLRMLLMAVIFLILTTLLALIISHGMQQMEHDISAVSQKIENGSIQDRIEAFRTVRQQLRSFQKAQLSSVAYDSKTDSELAEMAQEQLLDLLTREEHELTLEGILSMRGFDAPLVSVYKDCANILLKTDIVTAQQSSVILDLVCRQTGIETSNVKIIPIN